MTFQISEDDLAGADVRELVVFHLAEMRAASPPGASIALDTDALIGPHITFWVARENNEAIGMAALRDHGGGIGELKSMRTHPRHIRRGVASALLEHVIEEAQACALTRLSLETCSGPTSNRP